MAPELNLLLSCARAHSIDPTAIRQTILDGIDWTALARQSIDHGLTAMLGHTLARVAPDLVPDDISEALRLTVGQTRKNNTLLLRDLTGVIAALANKGIAAVPVRGPVLALQAYGDIALRACQDIEILVRDDDMARAMAALPELGYARKTAGTGAGRETHNDLFHNKASGTRVRPLTRLAPASVAPGMDVAGLWRRAGQASVGGRDMLLLAPEDSLLLLALHGGSRAWKRICLASDVAAFIGAHPDLDWPAILARAKAQDIAPHLLAATALARRCFGTVIPEIGIPGIGQTDAIALIDRVVESWERDDAVPATQEVFAIPDCARPATPNLKPEQEKHEAARQDALRALDSDPANRKARSALAHALARLGRNKDAAAVFRTLVAIDPHDPQALLGLGNVLLAADQLDEALSHFRLALSMAPENADAHFGMGRVLLMMEQHDQAGAAFERSLALRPDFPDALNSLGGVHLEAGAFDQAKSVLTRAMNLAPGNVMTLHFLTLAGKVQSGDPVLANLQSLLARASTLSALAREFLHFALDKAYRDIGEPDTGFRHLREANAIRRQRIGYDEAVNLAEMEEIRAAFSTPLRTPEPGAGNPSQVPLFIVGMPRSGSTLIEQILASHPDVFGAGESSELSHAMKRAWLESGTLEAPAKFSASTPPVLLEKIGTHYVEAMRRQAPDAARIVDKMLSNFRRIGLIHLALPGARIIHAMRDPIDTCLSCFSHEGSVPYTHELGELGRYYRGYSQLMAHWRAVLPPGVMLEVSYELLVRDFEPWARRVVAHSGLAWDDACLNFHQTRRLVRTASFVQVRQPLYQTSIGKWRPDEETLAPLLRALAGD